MSRFAIATAEGETTLEIRGVYDSLAKARDVVGGVLYELDTQSAYIIEFVDEVEVEERPAVVRVRRKTLRNRPRAKKSEASPDETS